MKQNARQIALTWACLFLRDHNLRADPLLLLAFVDAWLNSCADMDEEIAAQCGIHAARECSFPMEKVSISESKWIEPEDLRE